MILLLLGFLSTVWATEISFSGKVIALHKDTITGDFRVKIQGLSEELKVSPGPDYRCLREALSKQTPLIYSFDPRSFRVKSCLTRSDS